VATISVRVEDDIKERAEEAAAGEGVSISEWTRQLMRAELGLDVPEWSAPTSLSKRDRRQLALLHRILQLVSDDEDETERHGTMIEVLERGFTGEYADEFISIDDELPLDECRLVWDILDMFRVLEASVDSVGIETVRALDEHAEDALRFRGFDFNDRREGRLAGYAAHLVHSGRWAELAVYFDAKHERGNSHAPMLNTYLRMRGVFQPMWAAMVHGLGRGRYHLAEDELLEIVRAWYYPR
jgi:uncharacterized protein YfbU (UPF0304 family)